MLLWPLKCDESMGTKSATARFRLTGKWGSGTDTGVEPLRRATPDNHGQGETMMRIPHPPLLKLALILAFAMAPFAMARADNMNITYYTIASTDPDANALCCGYSSNEVLSSLGIHGLPLLNAAATLSGGKLPTDVNAFGELTYWSPAFNPNVTLTSTGVVNLPFNVPANFFPPNGTGSQDGGANGYQAAYLSSTLTAPTAESITFTIGSDDMAFAYLDGQAVCIDGGVHASTPGACTTGIIGAGNHSLQLFFVDINQVQSGLTFSVDTEGVTTNVTPEPGTLSLLGSGLVMLAGFARRRFALTH
jgi:hypothetical protein